MCITINNDNIDIKSLLHEDMTSEPRNTQNETYLTWQLSISGYYMMDSHFSYSPRPQLTDVITTLQVHTYHGF